MAQVTQGVRTILSHPLIYSTFQRMMGAHQVRTRLVEDFIRPHAGINVLDIGCGPADILGYLPDVDYWGFDISEVYIKRSLVRFGNRGKFFCQRLMASDVDKMPIFDIVIALGLIHHLDDEGALDIMRLALRALKPGGSLITLDPCIEPGQSPVARFLVMHDRGQNVRTRAGYTSLAASVFENPRIEVQHQSWIPYTHCFMECTCK